VIGIALAGKARAYPVETLAKAGRIENEIASQRVVLVHKPDGAKITVQPDGAKVVHTFWFAWSAFHPDTQLYGHSHQTSEQSSDE